MDVTQFAQYGGYAPSIMEADSTKCSPQSDAPGKVKTQRKKVQRTVFSQKQQDALEERFREQNFLSKEERKEFAEHLQLTERQVMIWFQNRRGRLKRRGPQDQAYTPVKMEELSGTRPHPILYGMLASVQHRQRPPMEQPLPYNMTQWQGEPKPDHQDPKPTDQAAPPNVNARDLMYRGNALDQYHHHGDGGTAMRPPVSNGKYPPISVQTSLNVSQPPSSNHLLMVANSDRLRLDYQSSSHFNNISAHQTTMPTSMPHVQSTFKQPWVTCASQYSMANNAQSVQSINSQSFPRQDYYRDSCMYDQYTSRPSCVNTTQSGHNNVSILSWSAGVPCMTDEGGMSRDPCANGNFTVDFSCIQVADTTADVKCKEYNEPTGSCMYA